MKNIECESGGSSEEDSGNIDIDRDIDLSHGDVNALEIDSVHFLDKIKAHRSLNLYCLLDNFFVIFTVKIFIFI